MSGLEEDSVSPPVEAYLQHDVLTSPHKCEPKIKTGATRCQHNSAFDWYVCIVLVAQVVLCIVERRPFPSHFPEKRKVKDRLRQTR